MFKLSPIIFITLSRFEWTLLKSRLKSLVLGNTRQIVTKETIEEVLVMTSGYVGSTDRPPPPTCKLLLCHPGVHEVFEWYYLTKCIKTLLICIKKKKKTYEKWNHLKYTLNIFSRNMAESLRNHWVPLYCYRPKSNLEFHIGKETINIVHEYPAGFMKTVPSDSWSPHTLNWLN